ncbi:MAG: DUF2147 domain-containing protein [Desulfobacteraceae bacterium]|nr:DUF2147 domain-containing protein [Desulfobacteraceae bacterium]
MISFAKFSYCAIALSAVLMVFGALHPAVARAENPDAIMGVWNESDNDAKFEIYKCGPFYCGRIKSLTDPNFPDNDPMAGKPKMDRNNPDPQLRSRPYVGMPFMLGFRYEADNTWRGRIYNPENGKTYQCKLSMDGRDKLNVRGYLGISLLGRTVTWTRSG